MDKLCKMKDPDETHDIKHCQKCPNPCQSYLTQGCAHFINLIHERNGAILDGRFPFLRGR
jgi:hypothetical protein